jgi:hypothetical protein
LPHCVRCGCPLPPPVASPSADTPPSVPSVP